MTRAPALTSPNAVADAQIKAALSVLIRLLAEQAARELAAGAMAEENPIDGKQA